MLAVADGRWGVYGSFLVDTSGYHCVAHGHLRSWLRDALARKRRSDGYLTAA